MSIAKAITSTAALALFISLGCTPPPPVMPTTQRPPAPIQASFSKTWESVLIVFANRNIPVTKDRLSGTIASDLRDVMRGDQSAKSCGINKAGETVYADYVKYRITVKGDSASSSVHAAAVFVRSMGASITECASSGTWEDAFEAEVKQRAEQP